MTEEAGRAGRQVRDLPRDNRRQNKALKDAARDEGLNTEQRRKLGRIIEHETRHERIDHDYHTIREQAKAIKEGKL